MMGVFVYLAPDETNGMIGKMLSAAGWKYQVK